MEAPRRSIMLALAAALTFFVWAYPRARVEVRSAQPPTPAEPAFQRPTFARSPEAALAEIVRKRETAERFLNRLAPIAPQWTLAGDELSIELDPSRWNAASARDREMWMSAVVSDSALQEFGCRVVDFYVGDKRIARHHL